MKRLFTSILSAIICLTLFAQATDDVNRLLIYQKSGNIQGYILDKVDYIEFETIYGEVAADVTIKEVTLEKVILSVQRTTECQSFKLSCFPTAAISLYDDETLASLVDKDSPNAYYQDFENAEMSGMEFEPNTEYTIITVGIDGYGVLCDVKKAAFTTPSKPIVGNPQVEVVETDIQQFEFTLTFKPNADVTKYSVVAGEKGTLQTQYESFAPMFGFSNIGQMIEMWGVQYTEEASFTWTSMTPGTEYEVFIQMWDAEGTMTPHFVYELTTTALGGEGTAEVTITLGDYKMQDWGGEMLPSQFITFTPNDQASAYRMSVYTAENYDPQAEAIKAELCSEPPMPMTGWYQFEELTTDYQINPNTECVAIAAAKNINGEWGPVTEVRFTTPAEAVAADLAPSQAIVPRNIIKPINTSGKIPNITQRSTVRLIAQ